jgi:hypothetical protein
MNAAGSFRAEVRKSGWLLGGLICACTLALAQEPKPVQLNDSGQIVTGNHSTPFRSCPLALPRCSTAAAA